MEKDAFELLKQECDKSFGLPIRAQDRNIYEIKLTDDLEVVSYARKEEMAKEEE
ncbi:MAG: hypothetical protein L6420_02525 [Elusimicrobia bacterium]|nr:hypothetical protein [Elusimicrobiota bacterium]